MIAGLDRPASGTVTVGGEQIDRLSETGLARFRRRQADMIFQFFNLLDDMTMLYNAPLPAQLRRREGGREDPTQVTKEQRRLR